MTKLRMVNDVIDLVKIKPDSKSHISIKDKTTCFKKCKDKPCTYFCPTQVYSWSGREIKIDYARCIECGASVMGCPYGNIDWFFPRSGYGISYRY
ncbi:ferredoxin like protein [Desulfitispora alkaliphila]|uniref:ferredoxin family protein n=1 Tax=Desulfitispora alkaliphila TaxID=622674 RepID=UPI003D1A5450